jgi:predicted ATP-grasp superfamily ATP-dependent carboligase
MPPKVVIIGHSYTSRLGIIRSVAQIGGEITVIVMTGFKRDGITINDKKPIDCYSKYVSHVYYCLRTDKETLIQILLNYCTDSQQKVVLFPDSDDTVVAIDNYQEQLKDFFLFPHILHQPGKIEYWMDKNHQKELARNVGLNVADLQQVIEIKDGQYTIPSNLNYPCFSKPLATMNGGKGGMRRCNNAQELADALDFIIKQYKIKDVKVLVEDYKEIEQEYALLGFSNGEEVFIPALLSFLSVSKHNKGIARQGMVMPIDGFEELVDKFRQYVLTIGFVGVFDIDFYKSNDIFYFCEINLRFGGSGYAVTKMGVNLPAMMVKHMTGGDIGDMNKSISGSAVYANERMCMDDWYHGYITKEEYHRILDCSDIRFVPYENDPLPEKAYQREYRKKALKKYVKDGLKRLSLR